MPDELLELYRRVRAATVELAAPLAVEDQVVQTMPDVSPTKWHLAHTTWFFETFLLRPDIPSYRPLDERYATLFNSYYHGAGERHPRPQRGHLSRPTVAEVLAYRRHVDDAMEARVFGDPALREARAFLLELGLNHEEQHQELILTDLKHVLGENPLEPAYAGPDGARSPPPRALGWREDAGGVREIGHGGAGFAFDNEGPRHRVLVAPHALADRLVTAGEWLEFVADGGYRRPELWLSDGWDAREQHGWSGPLYLRPGGRLFTLRGARPVDPAEPVCHVSYYEADAYARWAGARLPTEAELEHAAAAAPPGGNFLEGGRLHPAGGASLLGDAWQWTSSAYLAYPGFRPFAGAVGEYNGKFMSNRMVLRGGSCFTPRRHIRATYRNFFPPDARWQMTGVRLARDLRA
jgi:ergothioneine biosynthesis protein EgtB